MRDKATVLKAILDDPDDDLARLAYADLLEEEGRDADIDTIAVIRHGIANPDYTEKCDEDGEVGMFCGPGNMCMHCDHLLKRGVHPYFLGDNRYILKRGFIMAVYTAVNDWHNCGKDLVRIMPVEAVVFKNMRPSYVSHKRRGRYAWFRAENLDPLVTYEMLPSVLPQWLMPVQGKRRCNYDTAELAMKALSERALIWAKSEET